MEPIPIDNGVDDALPDWESDDAFGYWFAGFVDGERHFTIRSNGSSSWYMLFSINLRFDDRAVLLAIQERLGMGSLYEYPSYPGEGRNSRPSVRWNIGGRRDCATFVCLLDRYRLRAKKARDYEIWREAVIEFARPGSNSAVIARLAEDLKRVRMATADETPIQNSHKRNAQLSLGSMG